MTDYAEDALAELEEVYRRDAIGSCGKLYDAIYHYDFTSGRPEKAKAIEIILDKGDRKIKSARQSLNEQPYHPIFIAGPKGKFVFFNKIAGIIFKEFELSTRRTAMELYNDGAIFKEGTGNVQISHKNVLFRAMEGRHKDKIPVDKIAFTGGNDLVFFSYSRYRKKLVSPVTATLYLSTLHNKKFSNKMIGTLGIMSIPVALRRVRPTKTQKTIFIELPFEKTWGKTISDVIEKAVLAAEFEPKIAYYRESPDIIFQIRKDIQHADLVIADITGASPKVTYEVGLAHGNNKKVIVLNQDIAKSPFDFKVVQQLEYVASKKGLEDLYKKLFERIKEIGT